MSTRARRSAGRKRHDDPFPSFEIAPILELLGAEDVPTGFGWVKMSCPFHPDRRPSAAVNHEKRGFYCHSCGRSGDAVKLLRTEMGLSTGDAIKRAQEVTNSEGSGVRRQPKRRASSLLSSQSRTD